MLWGKKLKYHHHHHHLDIFTLKMWSRNSIYKVRDIRVVGIEETCGGMITLCYTPGKSLDSRLDEECIHQRTHMAVFLIILPWSIFCPMPCTTNTIWVVCDGLSSNVASST